MVLKKQMTLMKVSKGAKIRKSSIFSFFFYNVSLHCRLTCVGKGSQLYLERGRGPRILLTPLSILLIVIASGALMEGVNSF